MLKSILLTLAGLLVAGIAFTKSPPAKSAGAKNVSQSATEQSSSTSTENPTTPADEQKKPLPLDPKNMDTSVKPGDDFYLYANGNWVKNNPVPPEFSRWAAFTELDEKNKAASMLAA